MLKLDQSDDYIMGMLGERFEISSELLLKEYIKNKDIIDNEYLQVFNDLFLRCIAMQKEGKKEKIAVISIFYLRYSILTESYDIQLNLYDENFYLDNNNIYSLWKSPFFMKYYVDDIEFLKREAKHNIVGFNYEKLQDIRMEYGEVYGVLLEKYCREKVTDIITLPSYEGMDKSEHTIITFGNYMDKGICIYPLDIKEGSN